MVVGSPPGYFSPCPFFSVVYLLHTLSIVIVMSRIQFSAPIEEIIGTLAGSVFQDSYMGIQIRTRVSPANPQTYFQQLRRGEFGYLSASWRNLSPAEQATWLAEAGTINAAFRLFISCNVNLSLLNIAPITSFPGSSIVGTMPIELQEYSATEISIMAIDAVTVVPPGQSLLVFATYEKLPTKVFTNPKEYSPVSSFQTGTDMSAPTSIFADWQARYGIVRNDRRICIKSVLIDTTNGFRGADYINCAISPFIAVDSLIDSDGTFIIDSDGTFITAL